MVLEGKLFRGQLYGYMIQRGQGTNQIFWVVIWNIPEFFTILWNVSEILTNFQDILKFLKIIKRQKIYAQNMRKYVQICADMQQCVEICGNRICDTHHAYQTKHAKNTEICKKTGEK